MTRTVYSDETRHRMAGQLATIFAGDSRWITSTDPRNRHERRADAAKARKL